MSFSAAPAHTRAASAATSSVVVISSSNEHSEHSAEEATEDVPQRAGSAACAGAEASLARAPARGLHSREDNYQVCKVNTIVY